MAYYMKLQKEEWWVSQQEEGEEYVLHVWQNIVALS